MLGLVGSLHCAGMCGPLALALPPAGNTTPAYVLGRVAYNLGRIVTYCVLGLVFGLVGATLWLAGIQRWVSIALGVALLLGLFASRKLVRWSSGDFACGVGSSRACPACCAAAPWCRSPCWAC